MKIVFENNNHRYTQCIASAASIIEGIDVSLWNPHIKPVLDMFYELGPDIVVASPDSKIDFAALNIAKQKYQFWFTETNEKPCINVAQIASGKINKTMITDVSFILSDTNHSNPLINMAMDYVSQNYRYKVYGHPSNRPQYLGYIDMRERADILASSKLTIDLSHKFAYMDSYYFGKPAMVHGEPNYLDPSSLYFYDMQTFIESFELAINNDDKIDRRPEESSLSHLADIFLNAGVGNDYITKTQNRNKELYL